MTSFPMCCLECCPAQMSVPTQGFFLSIFLPLKGTAGKWMFQIKLKENDKATAFWWDDVKNLVGAQLVGKTKCQWAKAEGQRRVGGEQSNLNFYLIWLSTHIIIQVWIVAIVCNKHGHSGVWGARCSVLYIHWIHKADYMGSVCLVRAVAMSICTLYTNQSRCPSWSPRRFPQHAETLDTFGSALPRGQSCHM